MPILAYLSDLDMGAGISIAQAPPPPGLGLSVPAVPFLQGPTVDFVINGAYPIPIDLDLNPRRLPRPKVLSEHRSEMREMVALYSQWGVNK